MLPSLDELAILEHQNLICISDDIQMMCDDQNRSIFRKFRDGVLNQDFVDGIDIACDLIQKQNGRIFEERPGNGKSLFLPA